MKRATRHRHPDMEGPSHLQLLGPLYCFAGLIAILLLGIAWCFSAYADPWTAPDQPCTPTLSDYDHAYRIQGSLAAVVWWCDQPDGLYTRWLSGPFPSGMNPQLQAAMTLVMGGTDPLGLIKRVIVRESTADEMELVAKIEIAHAPHCYVIGTAATAPVLTANAQGTISAAKLDSAGVGVRVAVGAPVSCADRLAKETLKRYCAADNLTDTKGRRVEAGTYAACKVERAPVGGW